MIRTARDRRDGRPDSRPTLLIADDDPVVCAVLGIQLEAQFQLIATAGSADEAVTLADLHRPDAALVDVEMPGGGALAALRGLATFSPNTCAVVFSAREAADDDELADAGAMGYIRKGLSGAQIAAALTAALDPGGMRPAVQQLPQNG